MFKKKQKLNVFALSIYTTYTNKNEVECVRITK